MDDLGQRGARCEGARLLGRACNARETGGGRARITSNQPRQLVARQTQKVKMVRCGVGTVPARLLTHRDDPPGPDEYSSKAEPVRRIRSTAIWVGQTSRPHRRRPWTAECSTRAGAPPPRRLSAAAAGVAGSPGARDAAGRRRRASPFASRWRRLATPRRAGMISHQIDHLVVSPRRKGPMP